VKSAKHPNDLKTSSSLLTPQYAILAIGVVEPLVAVDERNDVSPVTVFKKPNLWNSPIAARSPFPNEIASS
jgi:hypothetical protein